MTAAMLQETPDLDFLYYSNDMIGAGGLLYLIEQGVDIPAKIGLAGFNGVELLDGLPMQLATMDACRLEIGRKAAGIIAARATAAAGAETGPVRVALEPRITPGDTLRGI
jgi:LacI family gluconate utilization system Gnt-I transcriptional repressor